MSRGQSRAWEERRCNSLLVLRRVCWPLGRGFYFQIEPDFHLLAQRVDSIVQCCGLNYSRDGFRSDGRPLTNPFAPSA